MKPGKQVRKVAKRKIYIKEFEFVAEYIIQSFEPIIHKNLSGVNFVN